MMVRTMRTVGQRLQRSVVSFPPAINILAVGVVADGCFRDAMFLCVGNQGLPEAHGLCYSIHSE